ncbi:MAG: hypothetical protein U9R58_03845, partial [Chloroflexota bacterium]|nr:hypothetical protein [Chloroflexota bacterium]
MYMGDSGGAVEQVSYATADDILGPYTKYSTTPFIPFGPPGSYDAGTVADPWVVEFYGTYYIGYTVSPTTSSPWQTAYATTTDWLTLTKHGITLPLGPPGEWDAVNSFRGAVTRIGDTYVFAYTGDSYQMGIATQPVFMQEPFNVPGEVFPFYDGFDDDTFDTAKWLIADGDLGQVDETDGLLTLTASEDFIKIYGQTAVGMDYMVEAYAQHPQGGPGVSGLISETGLAGFSFDNTVRMADNFNYPGMWSYQVKDSSVSGDPWATMAQPSDTDWHIFRTYRTSPDLAGFQIDDNPAETATTSVPTIDLPAFLMSYGSGNQFIIDWIRVRKWCGAEAVTDVKDSQIPTAVILTSFTAEPQGSAILVSWETATEVDLVGFNLYRSESIGGARGKLNSVLIPAKAMG